MEVIDYEIPTSWNAKGMDWRIPDPRKADYIMAIRQALFERAAAAHESLYWDVPKISPMKTVSIKTVEWVCRAVMQLAPHFFRKDYDDYEDDWSDFPHMWTYGELIAEEGCRICEWPKTGDILHDGGEWLKRAKNVIDKMTVIRLPQAWGYEVRRNGARHDPPFDESIGDAFAQAFSEQGMKQSVFSRAPSSIHAWSGNTHWKCPVPDREDEDNVDGYCGYVSAVGYDFRAVRSWVKDAECDLLGYALVEAPTGPVSYSQELATSVFDTGESQFKRGMNAVKAYHVKDPTDISWRFGNIDSVPKNEVVPTSDFDEDGNATHRRSAKRGYEGECWFFLDYGCSNGFKFRSTQSEET